MRRLFYALVAATALTTSAIAQVKVGIIVSATGPAASVGVTQQRTVGILPSELGGQKAEYILLDDASDASTTVKHAKKLVTEDKVDVILGPSLTPNSLALLEYITEQKTPMISLAGSASIVDPVDAKRAWVFKTPQSDAQMASVIIAHMKKRGLKSVGLIGFSDAYGEGWIRVMTQLAQDAGIKVVASERFQRTDSSVLGQILKIMAMNPEAVFIAASGRRRRCHRRRSPSAATRASSIKRMASPTTISCASAARRSKARSFPRGRFSSPNSCPTIIPPRRPRSISSSATRRCPAPAHVPLSPPISGTRNSSCRTPCGARRRKASPARKRSGAACATPSKRRAASQARTASTICRRPIISASTNGPAF